MAEERKPDTIVEATVVRAMRWQEPGADECVNVKPGDKVKCRVHQLKQFGGSPMVDGVPGNAPMLLEDPKAAKAAIDTLASLQRKTIVTDPSVDAK